VWFDLSVIIDIFSRYVVDWMVAPGESAEPAEAFLARAAAGQNVKPGTLNIHADRGTSMTLRAWPNCSPTWASAVTHSRPHVSNDNPYSEAAFKTLKYCPEQFFSYYNHEHRHSGIGLHTPASVHYGTAAQIRVQRAVTLDAAYAANPARFRHRRPSPPKLPTVAWINKPTIESDAQKNGWRIVSDSLTGSVPSASIACSRT
jgi:putative transposase